jgi:hypothetical protein
MARTLLIKGLRKPRTSTLGEQSPVRLLKLSLLACSFLVLFVSLAQPLCAQTSGATQEYYLNSEMPWHRVVLDSSERLLAWYHPEANLGYDQFMRLDWDFLEHKVPVDPHTGTKVYLTAAMFDPTSLQGKYWQYNPAGTFSHLADVLIAWYPYSGDAAAIEVLREMLNYQLAHGTTPLDWNWAGVPFATSCLGDKEYGRCLKDMPNDFYGGIETDKIGELGLSYVFFYELTGERKYLDAGIKCADQLVKHVRSGDAYHTPWPFRVDARTGAVLAGEEYGGMIVAPVRLFRELVRIGEGDSSNYKKVADAAWKWILDNPLNINSEAWDKWSGYYEDVPKDVVNVNDMSSMMTCYYILSQDDPASVDPDWKIHVGQLLDRSRLLLGRGPFFGAWAIDEQLRPDGGIIGAGPGEEKFLPRGGALLGTDSRGCCLRAGLVCRTSQWGAINAMFYEKTLDGKAREDAFRSLNYATYFALSDGKIACCGWGWADQPDNGPYWFEDGYADAGRSFMWALGAVPEFAPMGQDHLLRSSPVVQKVKYANRRIDYQTFDKSGTEVLRLSFNPVRITAGGGSLVEREDLKADGYTIKSYRTGTTKFGCITFSRTRSSSRVTEKSFFRK